MEYKKSNWMRINSGENRLRVASKWVKRETHWDAAAKKYWSCIGAACVYCQSGDKKGVKFLMFAFNRGGVSGECSILEVGWSVIKQLEAFKQDPEYAWEGDVMSYDIKIKKEGEGLSTIYSVMAGRLTSELSEVEKHALAEMGDIERINGAIYKKNMPAGALEPTPLEEEIKLEEIPF
jgi:hypothetical protein